MVKWFFLIFILALSAAMLGAALDAETGWVSKGLVLSAVIAFSASLIAIWLGSYFSWFKAAGLLIYGHAGLMLSAGIGIISLGVQGLISHDCKFLQNSTTNTSLLAKVGTLASNGSVCTALSALLIAFGIFMLLPSLQLFLGLTIRSRGDGLQPRP